MADATITRRVDPRTRHFSPLGLGAPMPAERSAEFSAAQMDALVLPPDIPEGVRDQFDALKGLFADGLFRYEAFTAADRDSYRIVEAALKTRFTEHYSAGVPIVTAGRTVSHAVSSFDAVRSLVRKRTASRGELAGYPTFDASLRSLMAWARGEGYFYGQRNRLREKALVDLRNSMQHGQYNTVVMPPDAFRSIHHAFELINRLWEIDPQPGRAYPGLVARRCWALGVGPLDGEATTFPLENLSSWHDAAAAERTWFVVLAADDSNVLYWRDGGMELTPAPATRIWGPGSCAELEAWTKAKAGVYPGDSVELLDRLFFIRVVDGAIEAPRSAVGVKALRDLRPRERWLVVRADVPNDALAHAGHFLGSRTKQGPCKLCPAEGVLPLSRRETVDRFASVSPSRPGRHRSVS